MARSSEERRRIGLTKDNRCWVCKEPLKQAKKGRIRLTCSDACRQARSRTLQGKSNRESKRKQKVVKARRSQPFEERTFDVTYHEPVFTLSDRRKLYECIACGKPYLVERLKSGSPASPYCGNTCEAK